MKLVDLLPLKTPLAIAVDPSNLCNFHCQFCPTKSANTAKTRPNGIMPFHLFKKIVDDIQGMDGRLKALKLWKDGEPLLNNNLHKFIRYAKDKNIAEEIRLTTNGSLLHRMAEDLIDAGLDWIMISYLSPKEEVYFKHTGRGEIRDVVTKNVELLRKLRGKKKVDKPFIAIKMCKFSFVSDEDIAEFKSRFNGIADEIIIHKNPMDWDSSHGKNLALGAVPDNLQVKKVCPYAWYQININFNGEVSICPVDWSFKTIIGDANKESINEIWAGSRMKKFRDMFAKQELHENSVCKNCTYYYYHDDNIDDFVFSSEETAAS